MNGCEKASNGHSFFSDLSLTIRLSILLQCTQTIILVGTKSDKHQRGGIQTTKNSVFIQSFTNFF